MAGEKTKQQLLDVGEQHFAKHGFTATSLRGIMAEAGTNPAAVHYHFGGKTQLFEAVVKQRMGDLNNKRLENLDKLEAEVNEQPLPVEAIINAFLQPLFDLVCHPDYGDAWRRIITLYRLEPGEHWQCVVPIAEGMVQRYLAAFSRSLPMLPPSEIAYRFHFLGGTAVDAFSDVQSLQLLFPDLNSGEDKHTRLLNAVIRFTAAGMKEPSAETGLSANDGTL